MYVLVLWLFYKSGNNIKIIKGTFELLLQLCFYHIKNKKNTLINII